MSTREKQARIQQVTSKTPVNGRVVDNFYSVVELLGRPEEAWENEKGDVMVLTYSADGLYSIVLRGYRPIGTVESVVAGKLAGLPPFTKKVDVIIRHDLLEASTPEERAHWRNTGQ